MTNRPKSSELKRPSWLATPDDEPPMSRSDILDCIINEMPPEIDSDDLDSPEIGRFLDHVAYCEHEYLLARYDMVSRQAMNPKGDAGREAFARFHQAFKATCETYQMANRTFARLTD